MLLSLIKLHGYLFLSIVIIRTVLLILALISLAYSFHPILSTSLLTLGTQYLLTIIYCVQTTKTYPCFNDQMRWNKTLSSHARQYLLVLDIRSCTYLANESDHLVCCNVISACGSRYALKSDVIYYTFIWKFCSKTITIGIH